MAYQFTPRLLLGIEFNPVVNEIVPTLNYEVLRETENRPLISFGTSSDRIGTPEGNQCYFVTVSKQLKDSIFSPYFSVNYSEFENRINFPFGVRIAISENWVILPMNDGRKSHLLLTYKAPQYSLSFLWVWYEKIGISASVKF